VTGTGSAGARLGLFEAMGRGLASLRANWPLVPLWTLGILLAIAVLVASVLPMFGAMGLTLLDLAALGQESDPTVIAERFGDLDLSGLTAQALLGAVLLFAGGVTLASLVLLWFQGGLLGVLAAADAQAPPGPRRPAVTFRTWSGALFAAEGRRLFVRSLLFWTLATGLYLAWALLVVGLALVAFLGVDRWGEGAGLAVGCGGAIPLLFVLFALGLGVTLGLADLPRPEGSAGRALAQGFRVLGDRMGASLGLWFLFVAASGAVGAFDGGLGVVAARSLEGRPGALAALGAARFVFQMLATSVLSVALYGSAIALVRAERARSAADRAEPARSDSELAESAQRAEPPA
jgi:hypothetical protein